MATTVLSGQESRFEVRAENLSSSELQAWTVLSDAEKQVVRKLMGPGAKLVSGPRGSGKSTLLRLAYFELLRTKAALPVYVNFSKALALEPLFHTHADALKWFRLWVLSKIVDGVGESFNAWQQELPPAGTYSGGA
jgi:pantothenate kinase-related protein Tda10